MDARNGSSPLLPAWVKTNSGNPSPRRCGRGL